MRDIAALLFGADDEGRRPEPFEPDDGLDTRAREAREWCQSTPGAGALRRLDAMLRARGRMRRTGAGRPWRGHGGRW